MSEWQAEVKLLAVMRKNNDALAQYVSRRSHGQKRSASSTGTVSNPAAHKKAKIGSAKLAGAKRKLEFSGQALTVPKRLRLEQDLEVTSHFVWPWSSNSCGVDSCFMSLYSCYLHRPEFFEQVRHFLPSTPCT
jgi:hypothetical protein